MSHAPTTPEESYANLVKAFLNYPDVTPPQPGRSFGSGELKVRGKIFAMLSGGKIVVKLPKSRVDALVASNEGGRFDPRKNGRLMKEWLVLASPSEEVWLQIAREAMEFVAAQR